MTSKGSPASQPLHKTYTVRDITKLAFGALIDNISGVSGLNLDHVKTVVINPVANNPHALQNLAKKLLPLSPVKSALFLATSCKHAKLFACSQSDFKAINVEASKSGQAKPQGKGGGTASLQDSFGA